MARCVTRKRWTNQNASADKVIHSDALRLGTDAVMGHSVRTRMLGGPTVHRIELQHRCERHLMRMKELLIATELDTS
jgi:hypothetical protein